MFLHFESGVVATDGLTLKTWMDVFQLSALAAVVILFVAGWLVSRYTLEKHILPPFYQRIGALDEALKARDVEAKRFIEQLVNALEAANRMGEKLLAELHQTKGA